MKTGLSAAGGGEITNELRFRYEYFHPEREIIKIDPGDLNPTGGRPWGKNRLEFYLNREISLWP
jgi:hypothetical protein